MFFESTDHCFTVPLVHSGHKEIAQIQMKTQRVQQKLIIGFSRIKSSWIQSLKNKIPSLALLYSLEQKHSGVTKMEFGTKTTLTL